MAIPPLTAAAALYRPPPRIGTVIAYRNRDLDVNLQALMASSTDGSVRPMAEACDAYTTTQVLSRWEHCWEERRCPVNWYQYYTICARKSWAERRRHCRQTIDCQYYCWEQEYQGSISRTC